MPGIGPMGRGGARRRTRRRMNAREQAGNEEQPSEAQPSEEIETSGDPDQLIKLAKLLKSKGVISEEEYNLIFD